MMLVGDIEPVFLRLLPILRRPHAPAIRFATADICAAIGSSVPALPLEVVDAGGQIEPHDSICGAMLLSLGLGREVYDRAVGESATAPLGSRNATRTKTETSMRTARSSRGIGMDISSSFSKLRLASAA